LTVEAIAAWSARIDGLSTPGFDSSGAAGVAGFVIGRRGGAGADRSGLLAGNRQPGPTSPISRRGDPRDLVAVENEQPPDEHVVMGEDAA